MTSVAWIIVIAAAVLLAAAALAAWIAARRYAAPTPPDPAAALSLLQQQVLDMKNEMQRQVGDLTRTVHDQLAQGQKTMGERLEGAARAVAQVHSQLGALAKTAENMQEMGRNLGDLQNILRAPKLRGLMGEALLEELLRQVLPDSAFTLQHTFRTGAKVDAVIRLGAGLVPVDAKFPLEAFQRMQKAEGEDARRLARREFIASVRGRVDEIADKYILPDESTYDFALMYIPAENVFYEVMVRGEGEGDSDLAGYARDRKVIPVSPNLFYACLMVIIYGLRGLRIEKEAQAVFDRVRALQQGFTQFMDTFGRLGKQIGYAQNNYLDARRQADLLLDRVGSLAGESGQAAALGEQGGEAAGALPTADIADSRVRSAPEE